MGRAVRAQSDSDDGVMEPVEDFVGEVDSAPYRLVKRFSQFKYQANWVATKQFNPQRRRIHVDCLHRTDIKLRGIGWDDRQVWKTWGLLSRLICCIGASECRRLPWFCNSLYCGCQIQPMPGLPGWHPLRRASVQILSTQCRFHIVGVPIQIRKCKSKTRRAHALKMCWTPTNGKIDAGNDGHASCDL